MKYYIGHIILCKECKGSGKHIEMDSRTIMRTLGRCKKCKGTGRLKTYEYKMVLPINKDVGKTSDKIIEMMEKLEG